MEEKAKPHKKISIALQLINRSDYPVLFHSEVEITFENTESHKRISTKGVLLPTDKQQVQQTVNNLFYAVVLDVKSNTQLVARSHEMKTQDLDEIELLFKTQKLRARIEVQTQTESGTGKQFHSPWVVINRK